MEHDTLCFIFFNFGCPRWHTVEPRKHNLVTIMCQQLLVK
uniref:Uncharacterized protein n=1 Tax=Rhizophora mucronata TaxID=61149 RepID=A0A2P2P8S4_RHIMU